MAWNRHLTNPIYSLTYFLLNKKDKELNSRHGFFYFRTMYNVAIYFNCTAFLKKIVYAIAMVPESGRIRNPDWF